jgi:hypothetical protein
MTNNPVLLAHVVQLLVGLGALAYLRLGHGIPWRIALVVVSLCMPVALATVREQNFFLADVVGAAVLLTVALEPRRYLTHGAGGAVLLAALALLVWPVLSTLLAVEFLREEVSVGAFGIRVARTLVGIALLAYAGSLRMTPQQRWALLKAPVLCWLIFGLIGVAQMREIVDTDAFWARWEQFGDGLDQSGAGFMGMDKPQAALWCVYVSILSLGLMREERPLSQAIAVAVPVGCLLNIVWLGSRIGLIAWVFGMACTAILLGKNRVLFRRLAVIFVGAIATGGTLAAVFWDEMDSEKTSRFQKLGEVQSVPELIESRDATTLPLLEYLTSQPARLFLGSGIATEQYDPESGIRTYAEGEWLRLLWAGGLITVAGYVLLLLRLSVRGYLEWRDWRSPQAGIEAGLLLATVGTGALIALGQFHLFTGSVHNSPLAYFLWFYLGLLAYSRARTGGAARRNEFTQKQSKPAPGQPDLQPDYSEVSR